MTRSAWVEAGARVIIKRALRKGLGNHNLPTYIDGVTFDVILDIVRTTYVDEFIQEAARWRAVAEEAQKKFLGCDGWQDNLADARLMIEQVNLAEEVVRDLEATL